MTLDRQIFPIAFGQGIDTKTDPKKAIPGKPYLLENAVMNKNNQLEKRPGRRLLTSKTVSDADVLGGEKLFTFKEELLQYNKQKLYSYSPSLERWADRGPIVPVKVKTRKISAKAVDGDHAINKGVGVYAWSVGGTAGIKASVIDEETKTVILSDVTIDAASTAINVRCLSFKDYLYVFYTKSNTLYCRRLNPLYPTAFDSAVTISTTVMFASGYYEVINYQDIRMMFCHPTQGANTIKLGFLSDDLSVLTGDFATKTVSATTTDSIALVEGPQSTFYLAYKESAALKCYILNLYGNTLYGPITIETTSDLLGAITGFKKRDDSGVTFFYTKLDGSANYENNLIAKNSVSSAGSAGVASTFLRSVNVISKAFSYYYDDDDEDHAYLVVQNETDLQPTYFLVRDDGFVVAKHNYSLARGITVGGMARSVVQTDNKFTYVTANITRPFSDDIYATIETGISRVEIDFDAVNEISTAELANNLHIAGGVLSMYDGLSVVEHGFHFYPEGLTATTVSGSGLTAGKSYLIIGMYEWLDAFGQVHRSAPSVPYTLSIAGGVTNLKLSVSFPTLRLTEKKGTRNAVKLVVYRTEADASDVFYRVTSSTNDTTADSVTITSSLTDAELITNEILYTTGGVLENIPASACTDIEVYKNRLILSNLDEGSSLEYSKEAFDGEPVAFNSLLKIQTDPLGGDVVSSAVIDDKLLIIKKDRYYVTGGDGPNDTGQGGEFFRPEFVSAEIGVESARSIVKAPGGIMLKSKKGIYLIDSSLRASYIGAPVEDFNSYQITSAVLKAENNQVRFTTEDGPCLVYNYDQGQWSTFTGYKAKSAVIWDEKYVTLSDTGEVLWEDPTYFKDGASAYRMRVGLGWLSLAGVAGYQRIYKLHLLGDYYSPHYLKVSLAYDFSDSIISSYVFDPVTGLEITEFGDDTPFGNSEVFGGLSASYQFEAGLDYQKCQSIKVLIEELITASTEGSQRGFSLTEMSLLAGVKRGMTKLRSGQKIASS